jgi:4-carboxymuconolactone decarboxylase
MDDEQRHEAGTQTRREVLGDAHVDRSIAGTTEFSADFQDFITRVAWGDVWQRPGLERRTRSCLTIAMLATLGHHEELGMHVKGALRAGVTPAEIAEVLMQVAVYAGVPAANAAFRAAQPAIAEATADG